MSKNGNSRSAPPGKGGSLIAGILVGMVLGLALAGGVAWYILTRPSPFVNNAPHEAVKLEPDSVRPVPVPAAKPVPEPSAAVATVSGVASGVGESKPRFEFYKVLTDKPDASAAPNAGTLSVNKAAAKENEMFYLQAGAFSNADEADRMKAKLAMLGIEASVRAATLPDKTVWHRVRLGPYKSTDEMNKVLASLKQNGMSATQMRAQ